MSDQNKDQDFLLYVVTAMVDHPNDIKIERSIDERGVLLTLNVNQADMATLIGKAGRTAGALRTLLKVVGSKINARVNLKIEDPNGGQGRPPRKDSYQSQENQPKEEVDTSSVEEFKI